MSTERTTSYAKSVEMGEESLLDRYGSIQQEFDQTRQPEAVQETANQNDKQSGSQQVKDEKLSPELRPPEDIARAQNAKTHTDKMAQDDRQAKADPKSESALDRYADQAKAQEQQREQQSERDQDYGLER